MCTDIFFTALSLDWSKAVNIHLFLDFNELRIGPFENRYKLKILQCQDCVKSVKKYDQIYHYNTQQFVNSLTFAENMLFYLWPINLGKLERIATLKNVDSKDIWGEIGWNQAASFNFSCYCYKRFMGCKWQVIMHLNGYRDCAEWALWNYPEKWELVRLVR